MSSTRLILSICGPSGTGKSHLAKALVEHLGASQSVRVPTDYYLLPSDSDSQTHSQQPLRYDWPLLAAALANRASTTLTTPDFDFAHAQRRAATGGRTFTLRPIAILDAIYPYPRADLRILLTTPDHIRHARIIARDATWGTQVIRRWHYLEAARAHLETLPITYDLTLPGTTPPPQNAATIAALLRNHLHQP